MEGMVEEDGFETGVPKALHDVPDVVQFAGEVSFPNGDANPGRSAGASFRFRKPEEEGGIGNDRRPYSQGLQRFEALGVPYRHGGGGGEYSRKGTGVFCPYGHSDAPEEHRFAKQPREGGTQGPFERLFPEGLSGFVVVKEASASDNDQIRPDGFVGVSEEVGDVGKRMSPNSRWEIGKVPDLRIFGNDGTRRIVRRDAEERVRIARPEERAFGSENGLVAQVVGARGGKEDDSSEGHGEGLISWQAPGWPRRPFRSG